MVQTARAKQSEISGIIPRAQAKVSRELVDELARLSGLSKREIATLIGLSERAIFKSPKGDFSVLISEHLLLLKSLFEHGLDVFDQNRKAFTKWLKTPIPELASPETGFVPEWPTSPPPPLETITSSEPYDLMAYVAGQQTQMAGNESVTDIAKRPYPTPFSLINTTTGIQLVEAVFGRIEAGVFS